MMPDWKKEISAKLAGLQLEPAQEAEIAEELAQHLSDRYEDLLSEGVSIDEAERITRAGLNENDLLIREIRRSTNRAPVDAGAGNAGNFFTGLWQDLRYGVRMLRKKPGFTAVTVLSLALGIGACTAMFSIVDAVLLRPLPYPEAEQIVSVREVDAHGRQTTFAEPNFLDVRLRNHTLSAAAEYVMGLQTVTGGSEPVRTNVAYVSADFLKTLGVQPANGRSFLPEETTIGGPAVALVSHGYWQRVLGARKDLTELQLRIGNRSYTVTGVMPQGFNFPRGAEIWVPIEGIDSTPSRRSHGKRVIARLREGVTLAQANADLSTIGKQLKQENGANIDLVDVTALPLKDAMVGEVRQSLWVILAAVGLLLLVACTNVANLLLAQATKRQREFAVRTSLGATRWRLARQFIVENLLLALLAGGLGILLSFWGVATLVGLNQGALPRADEISVNLRVMAFTLALSTLVAVALGLVPLLRFGKGGLQKGLKEMARGQSATATSNRLRALLVVTQVALTLVLLVGAGLLIKSFVKVLEINPGFRTESAVAMEISPSNDVRPGGYSSDDAGRKRRSTFYQLVLERIAALPDVTASGGINGLPMTGTGADGEFLIDNNPALKGYGEFRVASPGYFNTMDIRLIRGRFFDQTDGPETEQVALISESVQRQYWPNEDPLGKGIQYASMDGDKHLLRIIGIVNDVHEFGLEANTHPTVYVHYLQRPGQASSFFIVARTQGDTKTLISAMRSSMQSLDRNVPPNFRTLSEIFSSSLDNRRFSLVIFGGFATAALLLATLGIYGVTSYAVTQRTQEIGIRIALGARSLDVLWLVIGQGMKLVLVGVVVGLLASFWLTNVVAHLLFAVSTHDSATFMIVTLLLASVALLACFVPARRATKVDPLVALRYE